jgi:hypothetical protein
LFSDGIALNSAENNFSNGTVRALVDKLGSDLTVVNNDGADITDAGLRAISKATDDYSALMFRCGQIIKGQS